jgi:hypothetical protein
LKRIFHPALPQQVTEEHTNKMPDSHQATPTILHTTAQHNMDTKIEV